MKRKGLEEALIVHCAPTLAGMKSAGLFSYYYYDAQHVRRELREVNALLNQKGVYVEVLLWREESVLVYAYRMAMLEKELAQPGAAKLLQRYGYQDSETTDCLRHLKGRLVQSSCFPHEIGVFLGYPLEDVEGFIENKGKNCKSCGLWKVYCNQAEKDKLFHKLKNCTQVYVQVFGEGRKLSEMTVYT